MAKIEVLRKELHQYPELSGAERETARRIVSFFVPLMPDKIIDGLGGHGVAVVVDSHQPGPTVMLRCELDAVPVHEANRFAHRSVVDGVAHQCGHDGHMAILAAVGASLCANRPQQGRAVLLFQPAEENGTGAAAVLADPKFSPIKPDVVFALHNLPGYELGTVILGAGVFTCASRGMTIHLAGKSAHAAQPQTGQSPARALCRIIETLNDLTGVLDLDGEIAFATVVAARLGEENAFGTAPGVGVVQATLRSQTQETMERIVSFCERFVERVATRAGLQWEIAFQDVFLPTINTAREVEVVRQAAGQAPVETISHPFSWSEDFGRFTAVAKGALFGLGAGRHMADLHHPDYDFPDALIGAGAAVFKKILSEYLGP